MGSSSVMGVLLLWDLDSRWLAISSMVGNEASAGRSASDARRGRLSTSSVVDVAFRVDPLRVVLRTPLRNLRILRDALRSSPRPDGKYTSHSLRMRRTRRRILGRSCEVKNSIRSGV